MRISLAPPIAIILATTTACENDVQIDPSDDIHCRALTFVFVERAKRASAPEDQLQAAAVLYEWYGYQLEASGIKQDNPDRILSEGADVAEMVNSDLEGHASGLMQCSDRALAHPDFKQFVGNMK